MSRRTAIVHKKDAMSLIPKIIGVDSLCYYLADDYSHYIDLRDKFKDRIKIRNLAGLFQETFQEIKRPFLKLSAEINRRYDSPEWWGGQLASRSAFATPLILNITYLFCAKKILSESYKEIILIVDSHALSGCISDAAVKAGYRVVVYKKGVNECLGAIRHWLYYAAQVIYFFYQIFQRHRAAFKLLKPLPVKKSQVKKRVVIRSWVTRSNFDKSGKVKDRDFGKLPDWLRSRNYEVWILPIFFNLSMTVEKVYALIAKQEQPFLIPERYLKLSDYLRALYSSYRRIRRRIENAEIMETDVAALFNEVLKKGLDIQMLILNLCSYMLKRLKEKGFEIDAFYYAFENLAPEKQFILSCRKYFPGSKIIGFQHTTFFLDQLSHYLTPEETKWHPLPDKIVCSGPIYMKLHRETGFPSELLVAGPNLRFGSVYTAKSDRRHILGNGKKMLLLPLTFSHDLAFELITKVKDALKDVDNYKVYIRSHALLSKKTLAKFINRVGMDNYEFADDGIIQEWLLKTFALISAGTSVTTLEAVIFGTPVIRVVPDNTFSLDALIWPDYPLAPVNTSADIKRQLQVIDKILSNDKKTFLRIGKRVLSEYYTKPAEQNLKVFL